MSNRYLDILRGKGQSCEKRSKAAFDAFERAICSLANAQLHAIESINYTPVHNHGVSLAKASDRKR